MIKLENIKAKQKSTLDWSKKHKGTTVVILVVVFFVGRWGYHLVAGQSSTTQFVMGAVRKGNLTTEVTGTGTVNASNQIDLKAKTSGEIIAVPATEGSEVYAGQLIAQLDGTNARSALEDAKNALDKAQSESTTGKSLDTAVNDIVSTITDLRNITDSLDALFDINTGYLGEVKVESKGPVAGDYVHTAGSEFITAKNAFDSLTTTYSGFNRNDGSDKVLTLTKETYDVTRDYAQALKDAKVAVDYMKSLESSTNAEADTAQSNVTTWLSQTNSHLTTLLSDESSIQGNSQDIQSAQLSLDSKQKDYNNTFLRAPASAFLAQLDVKVGDNVSNGTTVATLITNSREAQISLNELDATKVKVGQKASLTFDALPNETFNGTVSSIDTLGTVSQGVVNYGVTIQITEVDARIKPGMSVSASIVTDSKDGVLIVPSSAIKNGRNGEYVETSTDGVTVTQIPIKTGMSNDTSTEVVSGLNEGDKIIIRTITTTGSTGATAASAPALIGGGNRGGGGGGTFFRTTTGR